MALILSNRGHLPTDFPYALRLGYNVPVRGCANRGDEVTSYDELGNLLEVVLPDSTSVTYEVDPRGRRVLEQVDGVTRRGFLYQDGLNPVAELDASGAITSVFLYATRPHVPDLIVRDGATYRVVVDRLGSVRRVVDVTTGAVAQAIDYDSYGRVLSDSAPGFQPFAYAGGLYDPDTGLVRFGARDYDAEVGRWTAKDPILFGGGDANIYAYVLGDPLNLFDPAGKRTFVYVWDAQTPVHSWFGHVSVEVDGVAYSWEANGLNKFEDSVDYLASQHGRRADYFEILLSPEQEAQLTGILEALGQAESNFDGAESPSEEHNGEGDSLFGGSPGGYSLFTRNCGHVVMDSLAQVSAADAGSFWARPAQVSGLLRDERLARFRGRYQNLQTLDRQLY